MGLAYTLSFFENGNTNSTFKKEVPHTEWIEIQKYKTRGQITLAELQTEFNVPITVNNIGRNSRLRLYLTSTYNGMKTTCEADIQVVP